MQSNTEYRVLIHVQHLLGVGHLQRTLLLAGALVNEGMQVKVVSGGMPASLAIPAAVHFEQLAPLYSADASFSQLLDESGAPIDDHWRAARRQALLAIHDEFAPQVLITETFPFGRRMLRFELLPLLMLCRDNGTLTIASIRDILQPRSKAERERETCELIDSYYQHVLVHGDPGIATLENSFGRTADIADKLFYSGYISASQQNPVSADEGCDEVIVSAGGSATGLQLLQIALQARSGSALAGLRWRLLVSPAIDAADFAQLRHQAHGDIVIERNRTDFNTLIKRARLSISQAGYNTMTDLLGSDTAAVVVPYAQGQEVEQTLRAQAMQRRGRVIALAESDLTAESLRSAMESALSYEPGLQVDLDGAACSARQVRQWIDAGGAAA